MWALRALMNAWQMYIIIIVYVLQLCPGAWTQLSSIGLITCAGRPKCLKCERVLTCFHEYVSALVLEATGCSHYTPWNKASGCILESPCLSVLSLGCLSGCSSFVQKMSCEPLNLLWTKLVSFGWRSQKKKHQTLGLGCGVAMYLWVYHSENSLNSLARLTC